jgi:CBS-domain-containing membrane protein
VTLTPDDDLDDALTLMARAQVRRLPVVVRDDELVGVVSQADVARSDAKEKHVGEVVEAISQPPRGPRVTGDADSDESARRPDDRYGDEQEPPVERR